MKPVNFDFSAASVEQDPKILHPVAVRLSPDGQPVSYSNEAEKQPESGNESKRTNSQAIQRPIPRKPSAPAPGAIPPPSQNSSQSGEVNIESTSTQVSASSFSGTSSNTSQNLANLPQGPKKEPPPPPPPRPRHNHTRSSSLDLNRLGKTVPHFLGVPPAVPPRMSPSTATPKKSVGSLGIEESQLVQDDTVDFADFTQFDESGLDLSANSQPQLKELKPGKTYFIKQDSLYVGCLIKHDSGAFEVYKKPFMHTNSVPVGSSGGLFTDEVSALPLSDDNTALLVDIDQSEDATVDRKRHVSAPPLALAATTIVSIPRDKRDIQSAIRAHRERNMMLSLLNNELNQELSEIMEERIALEIQLEHMKPFS